MKISLVPHTVVLFVGPESKRKTDYVQETLLPQLIFEDEKTGMRLKTTYVQDSNIDLMLHIEAAMSFPDNSEFIIVDTLGYDETFRSEIRQLAKTYAYKISCIVFEGKKKGDLEQLEQLKELRNEVLRQLSKEQYQGVHRISDKVDLPVEIDGLDLYRRVHLPLDESHIYITDVHECLEEFQATLIHYGFEIIAGKLVAPVDKSNVKFVLMGDYVDKGGNTKAIIEFLYENRSFFHFIVGNHENFVYKLLKGIIDGTQVSKATQYKYFTSIPYIHDDEELHEKFNILFEQAVPFLKAIGTDARPTIYATHAPCKNKYLGKIHPYTRARARNFRINRSEDIQGQIAFIRDEANVAHPFHLFGHVMSQNYIYEQNKIGMDTGCVAGNKLTSVVFEQGQPVFTQVDAISAREKVELPNLFHR